MITLRGRWLWIWGGWHVFWLAGMVWVPFFAPDWSAWYYRVLYTVFLPLELLGVRAMQKEKGENVATTLSEWRQFIAQFGKGHAASGWKALAAGTAMVDAAMVWYIAKDVHPLVGALMGVVVWLWLAPHFGWRERVR